MSERGGAFDAETVVGPGSYEAAASAAGAACGMAEALLAREGRVGFCATRPPGHHARRDSTSGFCLLNNVAVAARHALDALGSRRIFILDWDVHHGDGTNDVFHATDEVLFASIHESGIFPGTGQLHDAGARAGEGFSIDLPVQNGSGEDAWLSLLEHVVIPAAEQFEPDLVLISAGYDAHSDDEHGGCDLSAASFAEMARHVRVLGEQAGAPVGAVLERGYALDALVASVSATMEALAGAESRSRWRRTSTRRAPRPTCPTTGSCERGDAPARSRRASCSSSTVTPTQHGVNGGRRRSRAPPPRPPSRPRTPRRD
jgi:acetoin utilization deacetylase AcuC-like enzyme